jgi:hypothetical protein
MGLLFTLFFMILKGHALSPERGRENLSCLTKTTGSHITLKIDWSKLRTFRIINGADYFDARQENNAIDFEHRTSSQELIRLNPEEGFSYLDKDNVSIVVGKTNEEYQDLLNLEIYLQSSNNLKGKIYFTNERNQTTQENVECQKINPLFFPSNRFN